MSKMGLILPKIHFILLKFKPKIPNFNRHSAFLNRILEHFPGSKTAFWWKKLTTLVPNFVFIFSSSRRLLSLLHAHASADATVEAAGLLPERSLKDLAREGLICTCPILLCFSVCSLILRLVLFLFFTLGESLSSTCANFLCFCACLLFCNYFFFWYRKPYLYLCYYSLFLRLFAVLCFFSLC